MIPSSYGDRSIKRQMVLEHLQLATRHVADGKAHITDQRKRLEQLRSDGHPTEQAERFLSVLIESQATHIEGLNRVEEELAALPPTKIG